MAELTTSVGRMLRALARRDNAGFEYWRSQLNLDKAQQWLLGPLLYEVFRALVELRFVSPENLDEIREFLWKPRTILWPRQGFVTRDAEALMRSALGERGLVSGIPTQQVLVTRIQVVAYIVEDLRLDDTELEELISRSERWVIENR